MNLLRLTRARDGSNVYINPSKITSMEESNNHTLIFVDGEKYWVIESAEDIIYNIDSYQSKTNR